MNSRPITANRFYPAWAGTTCIAFPDGPAMQLTPFLSDSRLDDGLQSRPPRFTLRHPDWVAQWVNGNVRLGLVVTRKNKKVLSLFSSRFFPATRLGFEYQVSARGFLFIRLLTGQPPIRHFLRIFSHSRSTRFGCQLLHFSAFHRHLPLDFRARIGFPLRRFRLCFAASLSREIDASSPGVTAPLGVLMCDDLAPHWLWRSLLDLTGFPLMVL